ncbi:MAG: Arginine/ornithine antiporter ArcD [Myxococcales bacterium]|nr:Arginine/ornithine antiporter ArcD [Myxococcales bacterium]
MIGNANFLAWTALALCFPVSIMIVARWRAAISVPLVLILGQLFLPERIAFQISPQLPNLEKSILPPLGALVGCLIFRPKSLAHGKPFRGYDLFIVFRIVGYFFSCMNNQDPLIFPQGIVPGLSIYTFISGSLKMLCYWWPSLFLGRMVIRTSQDLRNLFRMLAAAAVVYSVFILLEMRLSPQMNLWVYGFQASDFVQAVRGGSYRPMVFMRHGLNLAFFLFIAIVAAFSVAKVKARVLRFKARPVGVYLSVLLVLSHSLGALLYAALAVPLGWFAKTRTQVKIATVLALLAFSYPLARALGLVPVADINAFVLEKFGEDRAGSLGLRLNEEQYIMERTLPRWVFGWGGPPRPFRLDPVDGLPHSTIDGLWAVQFGQEGAVGFICLFGMLLYPVWRSRRALSKLTTPDDRTMVASLTFMVTLFMVDLIPNSGVDPYLIFLTGALAGVGTRGLEPDPVPLAPAYA